VVYVVNYQAIGDWTVGMFPNPLIAVDMPLSLVFIPIVNPHPLVVWSWIPARIDVKIGIPHSA
jgi:hypothetical protein